METHLTASAYPPAAAIVDPSNLDRLHQGFPYRLHDDGLRSLVHWNAHPGEPGAIAQRCLTYPTRSGPSRIRVELFTRTKKALSHLETLA